MTKQKNNKVLNLLLWAVQVAVTFMFIMAGLFKTNQPFEVMVETTPWVASVPLELVKFIGFCEFVGAVGLILPSIFRIKPFLTIWAALGLGLIMSLAAVFHVYRGEFSAIGMNIFLMSLAFFIAWGRSKKVPIESKS